MISDFKDYCAWMYVVIDDMWLKIVRLFTRSGPRLECPGSELLAMALIGKYRGWNVETELLSNWQSTLQETDGFGYKLHLLIALNGVILDFALALAHEYDLEADSSFCNTFSSAPYNES